SMTIMGEAELSGAFCKLFIALAFLRTRSACDEWDAFNAIRHRRQWPLHPLFIYFREFAISFNLVEERVCRSVHFLLTQPGTGTVVDALELDLIFPVSRFRFVQSIHVEHVAAKPFDLAGNERLDRRSITIKAKDISAKRRILGHLCILRGCACDADAFEFRHIGV